MDVPEELAQRYNAMQEAGGPRFRSGEYPLWTGVPEKDVANVIVASILKPDADFGRIFDVLQTLGERVYLSGRDYPVHVTIQQGSPVAGVSPTAVNMTEQEVASLRKVTFRFEHLVFSGGNVLLCGAVIPPAVTAVRRSLSASMEGIGLSPSPISILHITVGRISGELDQVTRDDAADTLGQLRQDIRHESITMTVDRIFSGTVGALLSKG